MLLFTPRPVVYRGSVSGLRISSVATGAFVDNLPSAVTDLAAADPGNYLLEIYDATGKVLRGYLSSVGDGEDLGAALNENNCTNVGFDTFTDASPTGFTAAEVNGTAAAGTADEIVIFAGMLFRVTYVMAKTSGVFPTGVAAASVGGALWGSSQQSVEGANTHYFTANLGNVGVYEFYVSNSATSFSVSSLAVKLVTGPSADGCTIVSERGGATANFAYKNTSFTYNATSYYCVVRKAR